jgi:hypothetical protein
MMLLNKKELIKEYCIRKDIDEGLKIDCWIKEEAEANFNIHIFTVQVTSRNELNEYWEKINNNIAINYQSILEKNIERWNIYVIYVVKDKVDDRLKYEIEQNKYATRKIVFDNNYQEIFDYEGDERESRVACVVENKLFIIDVKSIQPIDGPALRARVKELSPLYAELLSEYREKLSRVEVMMEVMKNAQV